MIDVGEHFYFWKPERSRCRGSQLLTQAVGVKMGGRDILVAIDCGGQKHLLIPLTVNAVDDDNASQGVTLGSRVLRVGTSDVTYADLHCRISSLDRRLRATGRRRAQATSRLSDPRRSPPAARCWMSGVHC